MAKVSGLKAKGQSRDRFVLEVDGKAFATLGLEQIERFALHVGDELETSVQEEILEAAHTLGTYDRAVRMLASRGRSRTGLQRKLVEKGEKPEDAHLAVERLSSQGLIDDAAFARQFVRSRARLHGAQRLSFDLRRQGVSQEIAREAVEEVLADPTLDASETLDRLVARKYRELARFDAQTRLRRLIGFLTRRGFALPAARAAIERYERDQKE